MSIFSLTSTGWSDNESVWGRIWRGEVGFDFDDDQIILEVQPDRCKTQVLLPRNRRIMKEAVMALRKGTRREGDSSTATVAPPPVVAPLVTPPSKFIEARPINNIAPSGPTKQQIRERAYQIYLARNGAQGDPTSDWVQAERELTEEARKAGATRLVS